MTAPNHVALLGADGMLGRAWQALLNDLSVQTTALNRQTCDITSRQSIEQAIDASCDTVINCAAWADVDGAESHEADATRVNGEAGGLLADHCDAIGATLVHYSTDYVFNGQATTPYPTDAPHDPVNAYGRSKAKGESLIAASPCDALVVRTSWLYAPWGKNFVLTMADVVRSRDTLQVVNDQRGRPTSAQHLAQATWQLLTQGERGVRHVTDGGECTWFDFACVIRDGLGATCDIQPCTSDQFPRPAPRPAYSVLDLTQTESAIGPMRRWRDSLADVLAQAKRNHR